MSMAEFDAISKVAVSKLTIRGALGWKISRVLYHGWYIFVLEKSGMKTAGYIIKTESDADVRKLDALLDSIHR